jgi:hypothetical protein
MKRISTDKGEDISRPYSALWSVVKEVPGAWNLDSRRA